MWFRTNTKTLTLEILKNKEEERGPAHLKCRIFPQGHWFSGFHEKWEKQTPSWCELSKFLTCACYWSVCSCVCRQGSVVERTIKTRWFFYFSTCLRPLCPLPPLIHSILLFPIILSYILHVCFLFLSHTFHYLVDVDVQFCVFTTLQSKPLHSHTDIFLPMHKARGHTRHVAVDSRDWHVKVAPDHKFLNLNCLFLFLYHQLAILLSQGSGVCQV